MIRKIICMMIILAIVPRVMAAEEIISSVNISLVNNTLKLDFERDSFSYSDLSFINETKPIYLTRQLNFTKDQEDLFSNLTAFCSKEKTCLVEEKEECASSLNESLLETELINCESNSKYYREFYTKNNDPENQPPNPNTMLFIGIIVGLAIMRMYLGKRVITKTREEKELRLGNEVDEKRFM